MVVFGYRGYGKSEGSPSEKGLELDGKAIGRFIFESKSLEKYIDKEQVFLFGRSLGGAVAALVALEDELPFKGVIIENTFTTLGDLVDVMFPILKYVRKFLLKSKFETIKIIGKIKKPILFCRSEKDELIPKKQMDDLYNGAKSSIFKEYYVIKNGTHNDGFRFDGRDYAKAIKKFVDDCNNIKNGINNNELKNENKDEGIKGKIGEENDEKKNNNKGDNKNKEKIE